MVGPKQHFVPQYYLKTFGEQDQVYVFDKKSNKYLSDTRITVDKIAFSKNFYEIEPEDISKFLVSPVDDKNFVDSLIRIHNERISAPLIKSFIELGDTVYREKNEDIISMIGTEDIIDFLVVQLFRTPFFRKQFRFIAKDVKTKFSDKLALNEKYSIDRLARVVHGVYIISAICNTEIWKRKETKHLLKPMFQFIDDEVTDKINQLNNLSKTLWISSIKECFITSDNPIFINQTKTGQITTLYFPLTKRCAVSFWNEDSANNSIVILNEKRKRTLLILNETMTNWAERFTYSYDKDSFD
jgi:hypothetical protein